MAAPYSVAARTSLYAAVFSTGYICLLTAGVWCSRVLKDRLMDDVYNDENESFMQETRLIKNEDSINLPTLFYYKKKWRKGYANIISPYRSIAVSGIPGSGKSFCVINSIIRQSIEQGYTMLCYDFKHPDLSTIVFNHLRLYGHRYKIRPRFYVIDFDNPDKSNRCNPLNAKYLTSISDAFEAANVILLNLNRSWVEKQGDFFCESAITLLTAVIWFLRIYQDGKFCTLPHAIELLNKKNDELFTILATYSELEGYIGAFRDAMASGAMEQLAGQVSSVRIPLSRLISPRLYWIMSGDDFSLDLNNPEEPKICCLANNPQKQSIYGTTLGLYCSRIIKLINRKGQQKCALIIDELPTIYMKNLDGLIATARSNKVMVCLGFQDFSQLSRDYGEKEARVITNTVGNIFSGQLSGESARNLSERFGKIVQKRHNLSISRNDKSTSINTQLDSLIPASKIASLPQGAFVGCVTDNYGEFIEQKIINAHIVVDTDKIAKETAQYIPIPVITEFKDEQGNDIMHQTIMENYDRIREETDQIVEDELIRISKDEKYKHLVKVETAPEEKTQK